MKKKLLLVMTMILAVFSFTACGGSSSKLDGMIYSNYIEAIMDCNYHGELKRYTEVIDATESEAKESYDATVEYYAYELMSYNGVAYDYVSEDMLNKYIDLAREIMGKAKYTVNEATKVNEEYQVKVEISPIDLNDITDADITARMEEYNKMLEGLDQNAVTEEQWAEYEEAYAQDIYDIIAGYVSKIGYKETVSKVVIITFDEEGRHGISDDDWYDLDDYVVDMK